MVPLLGTVSYSVNYQACHQSTTNGIKFLSLFISMAEESLYEALLFVFSGLFTPSRFYMIFFVYWTGLVLFLLPLLHSSSDLTSEYWSFIHAFMISFFIYQCGMSGFGFLYWIFSFIGLSSFFASLGLSMSSFFALVFSMNPVLGGWPLKYVRICFIR
jgi:hypothetical protein